MKNLALARLDEAVKTAIVRETATPALPRGKRHGETKRIAGFTVAADPDGSIALEERRQKATAFKAGTVRLANLLAQVGIMAVAFVPKGAWERLLERKRLLKIDPGQNGEVKVFTLSLRDKIRDDVLPGWQRAFRVSVVKHAGACLALALASGYALLASGMSTLHTTMPLSSADKSWCILLFCLCAYTLFYWSEGDSLKRWRVLLQERLRARADEVIGAMSHEQFLRALLLREYEAEGHEYLKTYWDKTATVVLPEPPEHVQAILRQAGRAEARGLTFRTVAAPDAVSFAESPLDLVLGDGEMIKIGGEWHFRADIRPDPIVYVEDEVSGVIAILAQFGDFDLERELIEEVTGVDFLF